MVKRKTISAILKAGVILMTASLMSLIGCTQINDDTSSKITCLLEEKYGEEFLVSQIGNRLDTDSVTAYCRAAGNATLPFTVIMTRGGDLDDDYVQRYFGRQVESVIQEKFRERSIDTASVVTIFAPSGYPVKPDITLEAFIRQYAPGMFIADLIIPDTQAPFDENIPFSQALNDAYSALSVEIQCKIKTVSPDNFEDCKNRAAEEPDFNATIIRRDYGVVKEHTCKVNSDGIEFFENFYDNQ